MINTMQTLQGMLNARIYDIFEHPAACQHLFPNLDVAATMQAESLRNLSGMPC